MNLLTKFILILTVALNECHAQTSYLEALSNYTNGQDSIATFLFTKAIDNKEDLVKSLTMRGAANLRQNKYIAAVEDLNAAMKVDSSYYKIYLYYGKFYMVQGFYINALNYLNKAVDKSTGDPLLYSVRAVIKAKLEDFSGSIEDLNRAINIDPQNSEYYINRGVSNFNLGKLDESVEDFLTAIKIRPSSSAYTNLGISYAKMRLYEKAIESYSLSIALTPNASDAYYYRAVSYIALAKKNEACSDLRKSVEFGNKLAEEEYNSKCK